MEWLTGLFSKSAGGVLDGAASIIGRFKASPEEKARAELDMERLLQQRDAEVEQTIRREMEAKERVIVAELQQGDNFTKRARPSVVYFGLLVIFLNYFVVPLSQMIAGLEIQEFKLPTEFWVGWSGIVATWSIGRTVEKRGTRSQRAGQWAGIITGNAPATPEARQWPMAS